VNWSTIASVPTAGQANAVYEVWQPQDGLTTFYLKVQYGVTTAAEPGIWLCASTTTNGAGGPTGLMNTGTIASPGWQLPSTNVAVTSTVTQWNCYLSGDTGRFGMVMWCNDTTPTDGGGISFVIERSINSSGSYTSSYYGMVGVTPASALSRNMYQWVVYGIGATTTGKNTTGNAVPGPPFLMDPGAVYQSNSSQFNGNIPFSPVFPQIGYYDNPMTGCGAGNIVDVTDQTSYTILAAQMPYGVSHTYKGFTSLPFSQCFNVGSGGFGWLIRYD
jgi:hypothetical protein